MFNIEIWWVYLGRDGTKVPGGHIMPRKRPAKYKIIILAVVVVIVVAAVH